MEPIQGQNSFREGGVKMSELEGNGEDIQKMLDGLSIEQRVAGLAPEQVLALYDTEQLLLALPDNALSSLSNGYLTRLSERTRATIRSRIGSESPEEVDIRKLEGYDEVVEKIRGMKEEVAADIEARKAQIRKLVACLRPDHALAGFTPEQVLAAFRSDPELLSITPAHLRADVSLAEVRAIFTPAQLLAAHAPKRVLAGLAPEQRVAGLTPEQALLAMPVEVLRGLGDSYLATLSEPTRAAIRARIGQ